MPYERARSIFYVWINLLLCSQNRTGWNNNRKFNHIADTRNPTYEPLRQVSLGLYPGSVPRTFFCFSPLVWGHRAYRSYTPTEAPRNFTIIHVVPVVQFFPAVQRLGLITARGLSHCSGCGLRSCSTF